MQSSQIRYDLVKEIRSNGGIVGLQRDSVQDATIKNSMVRDTVIRYGGATDIAQTALCPNMGAVVGHLENSNLIDVGAVNVTFDTKDLSSAYLLFWNQLQNVGNGTGRVYGKLMGNCTVSWGIGKTFDITYTDTGC